MISERKLVASHTSFWRNLMPMSESFVRRMNVTLVRISDPRIRKFKGNRNALISELSFRLFSYSVNENISLEKLREQKETVTSIATEAHSYISRLEGADENANPFENVEIEESFFWGKSLFDFTRFIHPQKKIIASPVFDGCGIIDSCIGDLLIDGTLYEIKNVERHFRISDIRQVLTYCALNFASKKSHINSIGLINVKSGQYYKTDLNSFALNVSGISANELLENIVQYVTADTPSK